MRTSIRQSCHGKTYWYLFLDKSTKHFTIDGLFFWCFRVFFFTGYKSREGVDPTQPTL